MRRLPPLNSVRAFEAAVRLRSFTAAASELGVTQGAISRQIKIIEGFLCVDLFRRVGRDIMPTLRASEYAMELRASLDRIGLATDQIAEPAGARLLRVNSAQTFATRWLIPRLASFHSQHGNIDVRIVTSSSPIDVLTDPFDVAFRRYAMHFPGYVCKVALEDYCLPACSPDVLAGNPLETFADIARHTLLCHSSSAGLWDRWLAIAGIPSDKQPRRLRFDKLYVALQAANDGLGVVLAPMQVLTNDIARGRLVTPFLQPAIPCHPVEILHPSRQNANQRTRAFVTWFFEQASAGPQLAADLSGYA